MPSKTKEQEQKVGIMSMYKPQASDLIKYFKS